MLCLRTPVTVQYMQFCCWQDELDNSTLFEMTQRMSYNIPVYKADKDFPWPSEACDHDVTNTTIEHHSMAYLITRNI